VVEYRAYSVDHDGQFVGFEALICTDDAEAIEKAKRLVYGYAIELWSGDRLVTRLEAKTNGTLQAPRAGSSRKWPDRIITAVLVAHSFGVGGAIGARGIASQARPAEHHRVAAVLADSERRLLLGVMFNFLRLQFVDLRLNPVDCNLIGE
jgi:hypothetical protein